jgi:cytoskeletal protein CcmA (bactofilin family)
VSGACLITLWLPDQNACGAGHPLHTGAFMFQRSSSSAPRSLQKRIDRTNGSHHGQFQISAPPSGEKSVIGNDLKIIGQGLKIISRGILQVDGEIEGDVQAGEVIIGEQGKVTGMVAGQQIVVRGKVDGIVCGKTVAFQASSEVKGDIHHMSFSIEQGAMFEGRSRRAADEAALNAVIDGRSVGAESTPTFAS